MFLRSCFGFVICSTDVMKVVKLYVSDKLIWIGYCNTVDVMKAAKLSCFRENGFGLLN